MSESIITSNIVNNDDNHQFNIDIQENKKSKKGIKLKRLLLTCVFIVFSAHFIWATAYYVQNRDPHEKLGDSLSSGYGFLLIVYALYVYGTFYAYFIKPFIIPFVNKRIYKPIAKIILIKHTSLIINITVLIACIVFLIYDAWNETERLIPIVGFLVFILIGFIFSANRRKIQWRVVLWGITLQFAFGILTIRWDIGRQIFDCVGDKVNTFLNYAVQGSAFVYGDFLVNEKEVFAFKSLATIFFLGFFINILYYYGIMQKIVSSLGEVLQWIMGTSICESVNSAANIFLGLSEAPLLLKPYLKNLTDSELHSIMTSGFATVSGTVLAAYISFGANPANLITSSVMSAPAALCFSKLMYPETEEIKITKDNVDVIESEYESVLDAASKGASDAFHLVSGIISSLVAFIAFVYFLNGVLTWYGELVGFVDANDQWTVNLIVGKIFTPISYIMGVPWEDCEKVGELVGLKTILNEFVAFEKMESMNLGERSKTIATFAICGFSNPGSIGITISSLGGLIPDKRERVTKLVFRAFFGGAIVCFMTACIAGALTSNAILNESLSFK